MSFPWLSGRTLLIIFTIILNDGATKCKYSSIEDVQTAELEQILNCTVEGDWDISKDKRKIAYIKNMPHEMKKLYCLK